jgi:hypothetical protein
VVSNIGHVLSLVSHTIGGNRWTGCSQSLKWPSGYAGQKATLDFWRHKGIGPKSANLGGRVMYRESDVEAWIAEQFAAADTAEQRAG